MKSNRIILDHLWSKILKYTWKVYSKLKWSQIHLKHRSIKIEIFPIFSNENWQILKIQNPVRYFWQAVFVKILGQLEGAYNWLELNLKFHMKFWGSFLIIIITMCSRHTVDLVSNSINWNSSPTYVKIPITITQLCHQLCHRMCHPCQQLFTAKLLNQLFFSVYSPVILFFENIKMNMLKLISERLN